MPKTHPCDWTIRLTNSINARERIDGIYSNMETQIFNLVNYTDETHKVYIYLDGGFTSGTYWLTDVISRKAIRWYRDAG